MPRPLPTDGLVAAVMKYGRATAQHALVSREWAIAIQEHPYGSPERTRADADYAAAEAAVVEALHDFAEALHEHGLS